MLRNTTTFAVTALIALSSFANLVTASQNVTDVKHTFYGCYTAGGDGSYGNPLTFATAPGEFKKCEIIYDYYTKKYLIFQDTCAQCTKDYKKGIKHIDLWLNSSANDPSGKVIACEDALTPNAAQTVERDPPKNLDASTSPLYSDGTCYTGRVYPQ